MYCNNCGKRGHMYKDCRYPITSCGNLIFRLDGDLPRVLMIRRKDSLCYIDLIRGKYDIKSISYIQILIDKCSIDEKLSLINYDFEYLWKKLWLIDELKINDDYKKSLIKFNLLRDGDIKLENLIEKSITSYESPEWEFPKGRRNLNENNYECAMREFKEETGYDKIDYHIINNIVPFKEEFVGENNVNYKYIYYIGKLSNTSKKTEIDKNDKSQISEISDIKWLTKEESLNIIRDYHFSRKKIIVQIFDLIDIINSDSYSLVE